MRAAAQAEERLKASEAASAAAAEEKLEAAKAEAAAEAERRVAAARAEAAADTKERMRKVGQLQSKTPMQLGRRVQSLCDLFHGLQ